MNWLKNYRKERYGDMGKGNNILKVLKLEVQGIFWSEEETNFSGIGGNNWK